MGLFKKKSKGAGDVPPLPEQLPPIEQQSDSQIPGPQPDNTQLPPMQPQPAADTHAQIPNDVNVNPPTATPPPIPDLSPDNLPSIDSVPEPDSPNPETFADNIPEGAQADLPNMPEINSQQRELPEIPDVTNVQQPNPDVPMQTEPTPEVDEDVPEPPAIFSDESFYDTPEEIKHLVKEKREQEHHIYQKESAPVEYESEEQEIYDEAPGIRAAGGKPETKVYSRDGPIFIDIDSFKTILGDIDTIKNDIKSSEAVLQHLEEIKNSKDKELERWRVQLEDIQKKVNYVDKVLFNEA